MKIHILTLFPESIVPYLTSSILGRAQEKGHVDISVINPRDFTTDPHRKVDDSPYGGGAGMVMRCQPLDDALASLQPFAPRCALLLTSPAGHRFHQQQAQTWAAELDQLIIICGHYEGIDARLLQLYPHMQTISIGDYVLTGGELAACCVVDAVVRLLPGVVGNPESLTTESHSRKGWLEYPHYTRPAVYKGLTTPDVLLGGNHAAIESWRQDNAFQQ